MRDPDRAEQPRGDQLVVRGEQRRRPVEDTHALRLELVDDPEPFLDAVELGRDVEPVESDVSGAQVQQRIARREEMRVAPVPAARGEVEVRVAGPVGDHGELHAVSVRDAVRGVGGKTVRER